MVLEDLEDGRWSLKQERMPSTSPCAWQVIPTGPRRIFSADVDPRVSGMRFETRQETSSWHLSRNTRPLPLQ